MRPIKFRAWYKNEKLMLPLGEITFHKDGDIMAFPLTRVAISSYLVGGNVALMQSTGLLDKNGEEIYEGDIVKTVKEDGVKVYYDRGNYWAGVYQLAYLGETGVEVIGNIYENPELLNQ